MGSDLADFYGKAKAVPAKSVHKKTADKVVDCRFLYFFKFQNHNTILIINNMLAIINNIPIALDFLI